MLTQLLVSTSRMFELGGVVGFAVSCLASAGLLTMIYVGLSRGPIAELFSHTPIVGVPIRWLMQARVARVLSAMLRHNCDRSESLRAATASSSFRSVRKDGAFLAARLQDGSLDSGYSHMLSGLPISLLAIQQTDSAPGSAPGSLTDGQPRTSHSSLAQSFSTMAQMLEQACQGHGMLLGVILQTMITIFASLTIGLIIIALFLPLIKLLNDLA